MTMTAKQAMTLAELAHPHLDEASQALRVLAYGLMTYRRALERCRDAAGAPADLNLADVEQAIADLRRKAEGKA